MSWFGGLIYLAISLAFWEFGRAVFVPELLTNQILELFPVLDSSFFHSFVLFNVSAFYFAGYFAFSIFWPSLRRRLRNVFFGTLGLFAVNVLVLFPLAGEGILGYRLPQGYFSACIFLFAAHWVFARALQIQERWLRPFDDAGKGSGVIEAKKIGEAPHL